MGQAKLYLQNNIQLCKNILQFAAGLCVCILKCRFDYTRSDCTNCLLFSQLRISALLLSDATFFGSIRRNPLKSMNFLTKHVVHKFSIFQSSAEKNVNNGKSHLYPSQISVRLKYIQENLFGIRYPVQDNKTERKGTDMSTAFIKINFNIFLTFFPSLMTA